LAETQEASMYLAIGFGLGAGAFVSAMLATITAFM
jgi:hypothetical protein